MRAPVSRVSQRFNAADPTSLSTAGVRRGAPANPSGVHFLASPRVAGRLVRSSGVGTGDLVIDFGAGTGAITGPLAATGARVLAVERDPEFARGLAGRFDRAAVRVVLGDARSVPLPHRRYAVVASIPFAVSTVLLRRLLGPARTLLTGADLIVEWGLARRLAAGCPRDLETAWWAARFTIAVQDRVPRSCFSPPPAVDAAHLTIRRTGLDAATQRALWTLLRTGYAAPHQPVGRLLTGPALGSMLSRRRAHRALTASGIDPPTAASRVPAAGWATLARQLGPDRTLRWPRLPRHLER